MTQGPRHMGRRRRSGRPDTATMALATTGLIFALMLLIALKAVIG